MTDDWKPRRSPSLEAKTLKLTPAEAQLFAQLDGDTTAEELALLTGLRRVEVNAILERWLTDGTLVNARGGDAAATAEAPAPTGTSTATRTEAQTEAPTDAPTDAPTAAEQADTTSDEALAERGASHLQRYRQQFYPLTVDERAAAAGTAMGADLSALCFDALPEVIRHVFENPHAGLEQARLVAAHHQSSTGLEFLLARAELVRDAQVQRLLWRNPQLNEGQLRRVVGGKRLLELWRLSTSREVTAQTRNNVMRLLRTRFQSAAAEERVELIMTSEGRALGGLSGLPVDGKTTALLCARTYGSTLLINNLAAWSALPPPLITHLLRQPLVVRQPQLRLRLQQHPNAPSRVR